MPVELVSCSKFLRNEDWFINIKLLFITQCQLFTENLNVLIDINGKNI